MKSNKTLIIVLVAVFILAGIVGLVIYLSQNSDDTPDGQTTPDTTEEQSTDTDEAGTETDGEQTDEAETGTDGDTDMTDPEETGTDSDTAALVMKAQELLGNIVASNDRLEPLVADCDMVAISEETKTFSAHVAAAFEFVQENSDNPVALDELADFPDQINAQTDRNREILIPRSTDC